jgi:hypothetical protein
MKGFLFRIKEDFFSLFSSKSGGLKKLILPVIFLGLVFALPAYAWDLDVDAPEVVERLLSVLAQMIISMAQVAGQIVIVLISAIVVPLMQYNDFASSPAVGVGWAVIRDVVNMFFVLILIAIAFGTILGGLDRFKWRQQVPRLLLVAIFINFSRMLCGLMIDFSQVIMMTFVSAIKDIAGGNFIQMFGLQDIMEASTTSVLFSGTATSGGVKPFDLFAAAIVSLMLMLIVLVTLIFLALILAFRIVTLWVLVTVAPLAWFFKSTDGILKLKGDPYKTWWSQFTCCLQLGPVLVFFLWLALAVAGSGTLGDSFPQSGTETETFSMLKMMSTSKMVGFIVSIALIFAGFKAADDACEAGGLTGAMKSLTGKAGGISKGIAMAPVAAAGAGAALAGRGIMAGGKWAGNKAYANTVGRGVNALKNTAADKLGSLAESGRFKGTFIGQMAAKKSSQLKAERAARAMASLEGQPLISSGEMESRLAQGVPLDADKKQEHMALMRRAMTDKSFRKKMGPEKLKALMNKKDPITGKTAFEEMDETFKGDAEFEKQMDTLKKEAPTLFGKENLERQIKDAEDIDGVDAGQYQDKDFRDHLGTVTYRRRNKDGSFETVNKKDKDGNDVLGADGKPVAISTAEAIQQGLMGNAKQKLWRDGETALATSAASAADASPEDAAEIVKSGSADRVEQLRGRTDTDKEAIKTAGLAAAGTVKARAAFRQKLVAGGLMKTKVPPLTPPTDDEITALATTRQSEAGVAPFAEDAAAWDARLSAARAELINERSTEDSGVLKAFDFRDDGRFEDDAAKQEFSTAAASDPRLLVQALRDSAARSADNKPALALARVLTPDVVKKLLRKAKSSTGAEQQAAMADLDYILNTVLVRKKNADGSLGSEEILDRAEAAEARGEGDAGSMVRAVATINGLHAQYGTLANQIAFEKQRAATPSAPPDENQAGIDQIKESIRELQQELARPKSGESRTRGEVNQEIADRLRILNEELKEAKRKLRESKKGPSLF